VWTILPKSPIKLEELAPIAVGKPIQPGPDEAVVVFTVRREGEGKKRAGFSFYRYDPLTGQLAPVPVGKKKQVRQIYLGADSYRPKTAGAQSEPRTYIFILPAGTYGLNYLGIERDINYLTELCMGTIAFTAEPGAVLHLGDWSIEIGDKVRSSRGSRGLPRTLCRQGSKAGLSKRAPIFLASFPSTASIFRRAHRSWNLQRQFACNER
jgi:hypothetical protein